MKVSACYKMLAKVASRAEAWIETIRVWCIKEIYLVASRAEAWIETQVATFTASPLRRRLPRGGVD